MINTNRWIAGKWVADNIFYNFKCPDNGVIKVDMVGMGCALIRRDVLEKVEFEYGLNIISKDEVGNDLYLGECGTFGNNVFKAGYNMYMDGDVVCEHLSREKSSH